MMRMSLFRQTVNRYIALSDFRLCFVIHHEDDFEHVAEDFSQKQELKMMWAMEETEEMRG